MKLQHIFDEYNKEMDIAIMMNQGDMPLTTKLKNLRMRFGGHFLDYNVKSVRILTNSQGKEYIEVYLRRYA